MLGACGGDFTKTKEEPFQRTSETASPGVSAFRRLPIHQNKEVAGLFDPRQTPPTLDDQS
jgi:hypothetical protein